MLRKTAIALLAVASVGLAAPTMVHGRVAVLPVVTVVAALQEGQFGFNFSGCTLRDSQIKLHLQLWITVAARRPRRARREQLLHLI